MKDRLAEQKVQVYRHQGPFYAWWQWHCPLHDCQADTLFGRATLWSVAQADGDAHARRFHHHHHTPHDL